MVTSDEIGRLAGMLSFRIPDKGSNYVRPIGRSQDQLRLVLAHNEQAGKLRLTTYGPHGPLIFHADTRLDRKGWKTTIIRKVTDATGGGLKTAIRLHRVFLEMRETLETQSCPVCQGRLKAACGAMGFYGRCGTCDRFIPFREVMGMDKQSAKKVSKDENVYAVLVVKPPEFKLKRGLKIIARWEDSSAQRLVLLGNGTYFARQACNAFGLRWDAVSKTWRGDPRTAAERRLLKQAIAEAGILPETLPPERS